MRFLILIICLILCGCGNGTDVSGGIIQDIKADSELQAKALQGKKIVTVRCNKYSVDIVTEDGKLFTLYGYGVTFGGEMLNHRVGIK